ncbi:MAG: Xaa-Pro peptidase family protein [Candidatus Methanomethylicia archaeon]
MIFSESIYRDRVKRIQALMRDWGIDLLTVLDNENYQYFTGEFRRQPRLYIPIDGEPMILVFRGEFEDASRNTWVKNIHTYGSLHEMMKHVIEYIKQNNVKTVGFDYEFALPAFLLERFKMANPTVKVVDARELFMSLRMAKTSEEIELMRKAQEIATAGIDAARRVLREGISEVEVAAEIEYEMRRRGAERFGFPTFVNSGYRSNCLHGWASRKRIERGELILIDVGPVYMGYSSDMARTFVLGPQTENQRKLIELYIRARREAINVVKPGVMVSELDNSANRVVSEAGYGEYYVRGISHGVGLAFEETPFPTIFPEDSIIELRENMTISIGHSILSIPGIGGVRVEDVYLVTDKGAELLVKYDEELIEV